MPDKCVCGSFEITDRVLIEGGITDKSGNDQAASFLVVTCADCRLIRQANIPFGDEVAYNQFYNEDYPPVFKEYSVKDYKQDAELAQKRFKAYDLPSSDRLLDVGSGSGAFVDTCRSHGVEAYGCEIGEYHYAESTEFIYQKRLEDVNFPTDHFNAVTCHDVIEHVLAPLDFIKILFRITKQGGTCIIEIPRFHHPSGAHHWKEVEHIWFFNTSQFQTLLKQVGFADVVVDHPVESKTVFSMSKPVQDRPSILLPPGIGDSYWEFVKLQAFLKRENLSLPDIYIACRRDTAYNSHDRAFSFVEMLPFVNSTGEVRNIEGKFFKKVWVEAYKKCGRTVFPGVAKCDYFISHNGYMGAGVPLDKVDKDLACNWDLPMFVSLEQSNYKEESIQKYGDYVVFYFVFQGTYKKWIKEFPVQKIIEYVNAVTERTGATPVFVGADWDADSTILQRVRKHVPNCVDLIGQTTLPQVFGLMQGAKLVVGFPSGLSIMSVVLGQKTLIIWNDYYNKDFMWNACPPKTKNATYFIENTKGLTVNRLTDLSVDIMDGNKVEVLRPMRRRALPANGELSITVLCVLKSGGDYTIDYVVRLRNMIARNTTVPYEFVCLTDVEIDPKICKSIKLKRSYGGWWSKVELFRPELTKTRSIIYFDLDTLIVGNIDDFLSHDYYMMALQPWNKRNRKAGLAASGMMGWQNGGTFSFIFDQFEYDHIKDYKGGDQEYISHILADNGEETEFFQNWFEGIYSYKRNCSRGLPEDARIVCFHGKPRPHQITKGWVEENWR